MKTIETAYEHPELVGIRLVFTDGTTALIDMTSARYHGLLMPRPGYPLLPGLSGRQASVSERNTLIRLHPPMSEPRKSDLSLMDKTEAEAFRKATPQERYLGRWARGLPWGPKDQAGPAASASPSQASVAASPARCPPLP